MKYKKYIKGFFIGLLTLLFLLVTSVFILITFYKKELVKKLTDNLKEDYGLILTINDMNVSFFSNWPSASIQLKNVEVINQLCPDAPLLKSRSISLSLNLLKLFKKEFIIESVSIKGAEIALTKNKSGIRNFELKPKAVKSQGSAIKFEINKINISNTQFNFRNQEKGQDIDIHFIENNITLQHAQDGFEATLSGDIKVGGLLFKKEKGAFLKNANATLNVRASVFTKNKYIFIHAPSSVTFDNHPYAVNAFIDLSEKQQLMLSLESKNIRYDKGITLLNANLQKVLSTVTVSKDIDAKLLVVVKLGIRQEPIVIVHVNGKNNDITIGNTKIPYSQVAFNASIVSLDPSREKGNSELAKVIFKDIRGKLYNFPFSAAVSIINFDEPVIDINGKLFIDASKIPFKPGEEFILKGTCIAKINYSGPTKKLNSKEFLNAPMKLNAGLFFNNISYQEVGKPYVYSVEGNANLMNKTLQFENLFLKTDAGNIILKGKVENFTTYALGYTNGFKTTLIARSDNFNLNAYLTPKTDDKEKTGQKAYKKTLKEEQSNFEFNVSLAAKKLQVRKVQATNASIDLVYKNKLLDVRSVKANACDGKLSAKGTIQSLNKITAEVKIEEMNVKSVFEQFENFGQKAIGSENLQGNIFVDAKFKTDLDDKMEVIGNTMDGEIKIKLKEGRLLNFEPLQNISNYIFRHRDFKDISFTEINQTCNIKGFEMQIHEMEIASNVLNLFVSGKYHIAGNSNINILVPWNNLKHRGKNYIPKNSGQTAENSKGLKLNYSGPPKKMKLSLGYK